MDIPWNKPSSDFQGIPICGNNHMSRSQHISSEFRTPVVPSDDSHNGIHHFKTMFNWGFPMGCPTSFNVSWPSIQVKKSRLVPSSLVKSLQTPNVSPTRSQYIILSHYYPSFIAIASHDTTIHHISMFPSSIPDFMLVHMPNWRSLMDFTQNQSEPIPTISQVFRLYAYYIPVLSDPDGSLCWFQPHACLFVPMKRKLTSMWKNQPFLQCGPPSYKLV